MKTSILSLSAVALFCLVPGFHAAHAMDPTDVNSVRCQALLSRLTPQIEDQLALQMDSTVQRMGREAAQEVVKQVDAELTQLGLPEEAVRHIEINVVDTTSLNHPMATFTIRIDV